MLEYRSLDPLCLAMFAIRLRPRSLSRYIAHSAVRVSGLNERGQGNQHDSKICQAALALSLSKIGMVQHIHVKGWARFESPASRAKRHRYEKMLTTAISTGQHFSQTLFSSVVNHHGKESSGIQRRPYQGKVESWRYIDGQYWFYN